MKSPAYPDPNMITVKEYKFCSNIRQKSSCSFPYFHSLSTSERMPAVVFLIRRAHRADSILPLYASVTRLKETRKSLTMEERRVGIAATTGAVPSRPT